MSARAPKATTSDSDWIYSTPFKSYAAQTQHPQSLQRRDYSRSCIFHCAYLTLEGDSWVITLLVENASEKEIVISSLAGAILVVTKLHILRWNMEYHAGSLHVVCRTWMASHSETVPLSPSSAIQHVCVVLCTCTIYIYILCLFHLVLGVKHMSMFTLYNDERCTFRDYLYVYYVSVFT